MQALCLLLRCNILKTTNQLLDFPLTDCRLKEFKALTVQPCDLEWQSPKLMQTPFIFLFLMGREYIHMLSLTLTNAIRALQKGVISHFLKKKK